MHAESVYATLVCFCKALICAVVAVPNIDSGASAEGRFVVSNTVQGIRDFIRPPLASQLVSWCPGLYCSVNLWWSMFHTLAVTVVFPVVLCGIIFVAPPHGLATLAWLKCGLEYHPDITAGRM